MVHNYGKPDKINALVTYKGILHVQEIRPAFAVKLQICEMLSLTYLTDELQIK